MDIDSPSPDPLDVEISTRAAAVAKMEMALVEMERAVSIERIKLDALRHAATLRPVGKMNGSAHIGSYGTHTSVTLGAKSSRGKQPGTISNQWRAVMGKMAQSVGREPLPPDVWSAAARELGFKMEVKSIRDWLRRGVGAKLGFIDRDGDSDGYGVSQLAIEKFNLQTAAPPPEVSGDDAVY
jgi:hypothetical protein